MNKLRVEKYCILEKYQDKWYWEESGIRYYYPVSGRLYKETSIINTRRAK